MYQVIQCITASPFMFEWFKFVINNYLQSRDISVVIGINAQNGCVPSSTCVHICTIDMCSTCVRIYTIVYTRYGGNKVSLLS